MKPFLFAGTAMSIILGLASFRLSIILMYSSGELTCNLGLLFLSFSTVENFFPL